MVCCGGKVYQIYHGLAIKQARSAVAGSLIRGGKDELQKKRKLAYIDLSTVNAPMATEKYLDVGIITRPTCYAQP